MRTTLIVCGVVLPAACLTALLVQRAGANGAHLTERVSIATSGTQGDGYSGTPILSADGRWVAFGSGATTLVTDDTNGKHDIFVRDRYVGTTERVSLSSEGEQGNGDSRYPSISSDGRYVAFESDATNIVPGDTPYRDVYVYDRQTGTVEKASVATDGTAGDANSEGAAISGDGRYVAFMSAATNLASPVTAGISNVFVRDRVAGETQLVTRGYTGDAADNDSSAPGISVDGSCIAFASWASNLVTWGSNASRNMYVYDRTAGEAEPVSVDSAENPEQCCSFGIPAVSADGRHVAFRSMSPNLAPGDTGFDMDIFVRDREAGTTERVSVDSDGSECTGNFYDPRLTADGRYVAFASDASSLVLGDGNAAYDVFVRDREAGITYRVSLDTEGNDPNAGSAEPAIAPYGPYPVAYASSATDLIVGDTNDKTDVFLVFTAPLAVRWPRD